MGRESEDDVPEDEDGGAEERPEESHSPAVPPRSSLALLLDAVYGPFFTGKLLANCGIWIQNLASATLIFQLTSSVFLVSMVSVAQFVPQLMFSPLAGALADRGSPQRQVVLGRLFCFVGSALLAGWVLVSDDLTVVPSWLIMVSALIVGVGFTIGGPAMQAMLPSLVREEEVARAVALDNLTFSVGRAVGPAVGGVVAATAGYGAAFALAAASHLTFLVVVALLRVRPVPRAEGATFSVGAGVRYLRKDWVVAVIIGGVAAIGVGADPAITLAPALSESLGGGPELVGLFASTFGIGAILGFFVQALLLPFLDHTQLAPLGLALLAVSSVTLSLAPNVPAALVAFGVGGAGMTVGLTALTTLLYARVPRPFLGRIMALWLVGFVGSRPLAAVSNGVLGDVASIDAALLATAALVLAAACACRPGVLRRPLPPQD